MTIDFEDRHSIDNPDYNWYVVNEDGILTGNEFKEDAQDAMEDLPPQGGPYKIYARRTLVRYGWDPSDNKNWLGGNISVKRPSSPYGKNPPIRRWPGRPQPSRKKASEKEHLFYRSDDAEAFEAFSNSMTSASDLISGTYEMPGVAASKEELRKVLKEAKASREDLLAYLVDRLLDGRGI